MGLSRAIARCRAGDRGAYREIVAAYADRLVGLLRRILGNLEDARDVAQETFVRAYLNLHRYDPGRPFAPWLFRIARNLAYNHLSAAGRRTEGRLERVPEGRLRELEGGDPSPSRGAIDGELRSGVEAVLARMRPEYREVLSLRYMARLEYEEIAEAMSIPRGTVKTWLHRAKREFRTLAEGKDLL